MGFLRTYKVETVNHYWNREFQLFMNKFYGAIWGFGDEFPLGTKNRYLAIQQSDQNFKWYFSRMTHYDWETTPDLQTINAKELLKEGLFKEGHHFTIKGWCHGIKEWLDVNCPGEYSINTMFCHVVTIRNKEQAAHFRLMWDDAISHVN